MQDYIITSYVGVGPLKLGMNRSDAHSILGAPFRTKKSRFSNEVTDFWQENGLQLAFSESASQLLEISLYPNLTDVQFDGIRLFEEPGAGVMAELIALDSSPVEKVGVSIFLKLGLSVTGFLNNDDDQKSATVFIEGRWDDE